MEEEDELALLDYRSPKGQLIKLLEQKMKKPEIDDSLGKVLDQFTQMTNEQTTFLENGIFHMNFAEDALLLQSCGQYYAKRVDKLWDELLQFHTRMVNYDEAAAKNCTDSGKKEARKVELEKLEERLNRGKRKKIKLAQPEADTPQNGCYVFDLDQNAGQELFDRSNLLQGEEEEQLVPPFEHNFDMFDDWHEIHRIDELEKKKRGSVVVSQYNKQKYRLKPYIIPNGENIIYDWDDPEEFNTREGRLISVHHIRHLFEYNDRCLLPDEDFTIAKLRFAYVLKKKWLTQNKIDPDAPYETYKAEYEKFQREYYENEKRKIQNMPQKNSEDLMKFYKALEKKEQQARQAQEKLRKLGVKNLPEITFESLILEPLKEGYQGDYDPYIPIDSEAQPDESVQIPADGDHEAELSNLFVDLPQLPGNSAEAADTLRSDSGYFDGGFEADDESDHEDNTESSVTGTDTPFEFDKDNTETKGEEIPEENALDETTESGTMDTNEADESSVNIAEVSEVTEGIADENTELEVSVEGSIDETQKEDVSVSQTNVIGSTEQNPSCAEEQEVACTESESMTREIKEFVKLGSVDENFNYVVLEHSYFRKTDDMIMILYNKEQEIDSESANGDLQMDEVINIGDSFEQVRTSKSKKELLQKSEKHGALEAKGRNKIRDKEPGENKKRKLEESGSEDPPPKRRKLTLKQIEKLRKSLVEPVNEPKWESFFSMNYQTESGEGEITRVEYESAEEDDNAPADLLNDTNDNVNNTEDENADKTEGDPNDLNVSGYHSDHDGSHMSDHCHPETPNLPLSQDSGIGLMDTSTNSLNDSTQTAEKESEATKPTTLCRDLVNFSNIDLIAELSKNTGISREELEQQQVEVPELTQYEQQREKVRERVSEWKEHIMPKLKKLDEHDFDIHEYGFNIMDRMEVNESKPFGDLVAGKSSAEVVRFFISSLQLANTMNVEICGAKKGELSNDTFELKLLTKERYHEHLQEYQAPSEESLRHNLQKVKQIRMQNKMQSSHSPTKRKATASNTSSENHSRKLPRKSSLKRDNIRPNTLSSDSLDNQSEVQLVSPNKKIKILNHSVINSSSQQFDFQQPSTSMQADMLESQMHRL